MSDRSFLGWLNAKPYLMRPVALFILTAFGGLILLPTALAAREHAERRALERTLEPANWQAMEQTVDRTRQALERLRKHWAAQEIAPAGAALDEVDRLYERLERQHERALDRHERLADRLERANVPPVIHERQAQAAAHYAERLEAALEALRAVTETPADAPRAEAVDAALTALAPEREPRKRRPFDPDQLPNRAVEPAEPREPRTHLEDFRADGLTSRPLPLLAANENFRLDGLAGADNPRLREPTPEVTLTEAIEAQAEALDHNPVKIYEWVRNHIAWLPTWGATQSAEHTLSSRQGNAFDIASLQIALLRASNIPARFAHGTIEVEAERFRNWAGGFDDVTVAADYAASGGIPITRLQSGGVIDAVRMEHVWVEVAVDYFPSRGAVMDAADAWVPLDPSFKQYEFAEGIDVADVAGIDPEQVAEQFLGSGTVDEAAGYIQGFDATILQQTQTDAETALAAYIDDLPEDATVQDVLGGRTIIERSFSTLPARIPNPVTTVGARYDALPAALQHRITFGIGTDVLGNLQNTVEFPWAEVNGERITLSFSPATADDEAALEALLPEGEIEDIQDLPSSIPSYLVNVIPELRVAGEVVATGPTMSLGDELDFGFQVTQRGLGTETYTKPVAAGSYLAVPVAGGSVSTARLEKVQAQVENTAAALESENDQQLAGLTREALLGDLFHAGMLAYFAQLEVLSHQQARQANAHVSLAPSAGTYGYTPKVSYFFGLPQAIEPGGVTMDLDRIARTLSKPEDLDVDHAALNIQIGALTSALEHGIPEQQFSTTETPADAVSAVKAFSLANDDGQRIYQITQDNKSDVLPLIQHRDQTMREIEEALAAGKMVATHSDPISIPGWTGAGYIIIDPKIGDGAYKISGGMNGSFVEALEPLAWLLQIIKDVAIAISNNIVLKFIDLFVSIYINTSKMLEQCSGLMAFAALLVIITLMVVVFAVAFLFAIISGLIFGIIMSLLINNFILPAFLRLCR